ncbi:hypothetical protein ABXK61_13400 [Burkholderia sola]|uniref:hypothetical protein n=1 Tax=Burkholderia TaxID=32008 RepID=UPI001AE505A7|nr:hypothetical protein [Burkholderia sp. AcTa6-5]MBP0714309.1 hypothetical protein [Burkholderia sp. AcTa6-5]
MNAAGQRIDVNDGATRDTGDLICIALEASLAFRGRWIRCRGIVPGATVDVTSGEFVPRDLGEKLQAIDDIWTLLRPKMVAWLSGRKVSPRYRADLSYGIRFEFYWGGKVLPQPAFFEVCVHYEASFTASYAQTRRQRPLLVAPPNGNRLERQRLVQLRRLLIAAMDKSRLGLGRSYERLPIPVRFRVSGALAAWKALRDTLDPPSLGDPLTAALTDAPIIQAMDRVRALVRTILPGGLKGLSFDSMDDDARQSAVWQAFELRGGMFYEPSIALHRLLDTASIADDVPLGMMELPADTLCILPKGGDRSRGSGSGELIAIFRSEKTIDFLAWSPRMDVDGGERLEFRAISFGRDAPDMTIREALDRVFSKPSADGIPPRNEDRETQTQWRGTLDYVIKMLLYLNARQAEVTLDRAYTDAARDFSGLGKRRRAERLEEIEQLYDRFIVGPALLDEELADQLPAASKQGEVSSHWRAPYFKMQHYGPRASLRKLVFVGPVIVRADRLGV